MEDIKVIHELKESLNQRIIIIKNKKAVGGQNKGYTQNI